MSRSEQQIRELAEKAFADHVITERLRQGFFRSWRCQKPDTWVYGFDITTTPGYLIVTGDIGDLIVSRCADMLPWCRQAVDSTSYFAEKVARSIPTREFSHGEFERWYHELMADPDTPEDHKEVATEAMQWSDNKGMDQLYEETHEIWDGDPPDWKDWNANFLWCREAVRWFLQHHEEPEIAEQTHAVGGGSR